MDDMPVNRRSHPLGARFSSWTAADGWRLRVMDWPQPDGAARRGSLLFLGGRGDFIEKYLEAMHHWHGRGWHVTSFDWRGQGASREEGGPSPDEGFDPLMRDLAAFARQWAARHVGPHVAIAHSMGGHLLLRTIAEEDIPLSAAVLVAPMMGINTGFIPGAVGAGLARLFQKMGRGPLPVARDYQSAIEGGTARQNRLTSSADRYADEKWWQREQPGYDLGVPTWNWVAAAYRSMAQATPEALARVRVPVLILATERDKLVDIDAIREAVALLPDATLTLFDAAHEILREEDSVRLAALDAIDVFFDRRAATA